MTLEELKKAYTKNHGAWKVTLEGLYAERCLTPHNINHHMPLLRMLASQCESVTELGTDVGFSTTAFLAGKPKRLTCYDIKRTRWVDLLKHLAGYTEFRFKQRDTLDTDIDETDLLFIDTEHTYEQVKAELERHGDKAKKFIVFHDIAAFPCIVPAIHEYFKGRENEWRCVLWDLSQSGMAVYGRL